MNYIPFEELVSLYEDSPYIPYGEYLTTNEWESKRQQIIARDKYVCQNCGKSATVSHYDEKLGKSFYLRFDEEEIVEGILIPKASVSSKPYHLEVHHKFYIQNKLPWDYDDDDLITLCNWCHREYHEENEIELYMEDKVHKTIMEPCEKCYGSGYLPEFKHFKNGVCFECNGKRFKQILMLKQ